MRKNIYNSLIILVFTSIIHLSLIAQNSKSVSVLVNKPTSEIQPTMWGIFFEDINFSADGGIYAELIKNRSFEFITPLMGWKEIKQEGGSGSILVINLGEEKELNPRFARITVRGDKGAFGLTNEGFRGIGVFKDKQYDFSILARKFGEGNPHMRVELVNANGDKIGEAKVQQDLTGQWAKYSVSFKSSATEAKAKLNVLFEGKGAVDIDMASLFPHDTWKMRPNGLRSDLVQMLADLKPGFVRFPGGCIVEGFELATRYQWKKTVGKPEDRKLIINRWNTTFPNRAAPDYFQSYGLGFFEYFLLSEDIGAEPLPIINCGMACQYQSGEVVPMDQLDPYIQDALDLIEFANGSTDSKWGKIRAEMGHPAPFNLKLLGVGNEQWDEQYVERYVAFEKALKAKYPNVKLISSAGPSPDGGKFDYLSAELKKLNADIVDEHYYKAPEWFLGNATRYDNYDRKGPKIFAGEYAAHSKKQEKEAESRNNWESALSEAALMTGLERNADIVHLASYAPLLAHVEAWQWRPDLIWFDNLRVVGTPNYYVQKLFSTNRGTHVVPVLQNGQIMAGKDSLYASSTINKETSEILLKLVNASATPVSLNINLEGASALGKPATIQVLASSPFNANSLDNPKNIYPVEKQKNIKGNKFEVSLEGRSVTLVKIPCKKF